VTTDLPTPAHKPTHACDLIKEGDSLTCPAGLPVPRGTVLTRSALRSIAILVLLGLLVTAANLLWTAHVVNADNQQRCGALIAVTKLPVPHPIAGNPSREWAAAFEAINAQRARELGCKGA
jgi:hypothetical protein